MSLVELHDIIKLYKPEKTNLTVAALRGIELKIEEGSITAIIGPSGSGKTTLLRIISGLDKPSSGTVEFKGTGNVSQLNSSQLRRHLIENIGIIQQNPIQNLLPGITVFNNIIFPMKLKNTLSYNERKRKATELLHNVDLFKQRNNLPAKLSGGEAQRLSIAVALANTPKLILADEPTGELDTENTFAIIKYFRTLNQETGISFLVVTHDLRLSNLTDKTFKIKDGRIYGLHRKLKREQLTDDPMEREHLLIVDSQRNLRLPDELCLELDIHSHVIARIDKEKRILEIVPVND